MASAMGMAVSRSVGVGGVFAGIDFVAAGASRLFADQCDPGHHRSSQPATKFVRCRLCDLHSCRVHCLLGCDTRTAVSDRNGTRARFSDDSIGARGALAKTFRLQHLERRLFVDLNVWLRTILVWISSSAIGPCEHFGYRFKE